MTTLIAVRIVLFVLIIAGAAYLCSPKKIYPGLGMFAPLPGQKVSEPELVLDDEALTEPEVMELIVVKLKNAKTSKDFQLLYCVARKLKGSEQLAETIREQWDIWSLPKALAAKTESEVQQAWFDCPFQGKSEKIIQGKKHQFTIQRLQAMGVEKTKS